VASTSVVGFVFRSGKAQRARGEGEISSASSQDRSARKFCNFPESSSGREAACSQMEGFKLISADESSPRAKTHTSESVGRTSVYEPIRPNGGLTAWPLAPSFRELLGSLQHPRDRTATIRKGCDPLACCRSDVCQQLQKRRGTGLDRCAD
jgi:hypothetical protein